MENPPKKFFRLAPGKRVRLKSAYIIQCDEVIKDTEGKITDLKDKEAIQHVDHGHVFEVEYFINFSY